ncbi:aminopeptidase [Paenibacillus sp. alder61]|uniref:Aminopeptidase n=1 Tax=Paenibacillus faecis TaxID=862114 RepID=A0A5D0CWH3_9BACL|nr:MULTISPECIES: aminopeptidase [Paenibacillus]MCA1296676.1 aminopeptidase [Paenibacillus sp. alder61]TYA14118.1 aminopeptidase [Paenibacillus faecis]
MKNFEVLLEKYAELVVKVGVNIQPGQVLIVQAPLETVEFTRLVVAKAYESGAKYVQVEWDDEAITKMRYEKAPDDSFGYYPKWQADMVEQLAEGGGALLNIKVPDPMLLSGVDGSKVAAAVKAAAVAREKFQGYIRTNKISWSLIKAPTRAWANKVFADLPENERIEAMWEAIFRMNRVSENENPIEAWRRHIAELKERQEYMNKKRYKSLHYRAPGTDLKVELPEGHLWLGGGDHNESGVYFVANMPTEEIYSMPLRTGVNGTVTSTLPLNLNGRLVEGIRLTFKDGKVTEYDAETGREHLTALLATDDGASYLGEVALVPHHSPISLMNRVFYNTGIDENASCHFALGSSYPVNIKGGTKLTKEELLQKGANVSLTHVDFMIGSAELEIDGELQDGTIEPVFRKGNWA